MDDKRNMPKVAVLDDFALKGSRTFLSGVAAYAHRHGPWRIVIEEGRPGEQKLDPLKFDVDGVIAASTELPVLKHVAARGVPIVFGAPVSAEFRKFGVLREMPFVQMDSYVVGVLAAEYYLERRYRSFAYVAETLDRPWSRERRQGFTETLAKADFGCEVYDGFSAREKRSWLAERPRMIRWLGSLPKPTAVFAAMDGRARLVLDACAEAGIVVPNEIAVLGVDNDPVICETSFPTLSSIRTGGFRRGEEAARILDALMHGRKAPDSRLSMGPITVVTRGSTGHDALRNPLLAKALVFIRDQAGVANVSVMDVVAEMNCSRRFAEMLFRDLIGRTVKEEIRRVKFERVQTLLEQTNLPFSAIADQCGFACESHLSFLFRKHFGTTMREWRKVNGWELNLAVQQGDDFL